MTHPPTSAVDAARNLATRAHEGQFDKIGAPYIGHPAQVVGLARRLPAFTTGDEAFRDDALVAAWLHDVVEDCEITADDLSADGFSDRAVDAVVALTRTADVPDDDYYARIRRTPVALLVKTADIASNLDPTRTAKLDDAKREKLARKYAHALDVLGLDRSVVDALHGL